MAHKGKLYLIPIAIADDSLDKVTTPQLLSLLPHISHFLVENVRTARRYLSSLKIYPSIEALTFSVLDQNTREEEVGQLMTPIHNGQDIGVMSEAGCPGIADPGALAVRYAHDKDIHVVPLVGPSSIVMALMSSGLNGQSFAFNGYLPVDKDQLIQSIRQFEKNSLAKNQTQIFIETPYRNQATFDLIVKTLSPNTRLAVAIDLTGSDEQIVTRPGSQWKKQSISLPKKPAVFLFLAGN
jgi:16S rRNA (cytidine1402-2'-O)-methyltransferase